MGWQTKVFALCKKYGVAAKFAATTILGIVPGGLALTPLIERVFDAAQQAAQHDWEQNLSEQLQLTADNTDRLEQVLDILGGDLQHLMAQLSSLQGMPEMAHQLLEIARENDDRAKAAIAKLDLIVHRFDQLEKHSLNILAVVEETRTLVRGLSPGNISEAKISEQKALPNIETLEVPERVLSSVPVWYGSDMIRGGVRGELKLTSRRLFFIDNDKRLLLDMSYELLNGCHMYGEKQYDWHDGPEIYYYFLSISGVDQSHVVRFDATCYSRFGESIPTAIQKFISALENVVSTPFEWRRR